MNRFTSLVTRSIAPRMSSSRAVTSLFCAHPTSSVPSRNTHSVQFPTEHFDKYRRDTPSEDQGRSFVYFSVAAAGVGYAALAKNTVVGVLTTMSPAADVLAVSTVEVDLSGIAEGTSIVVKYRGKPLFIRHRPQEEIDEAVNVDVATLPDPESDAARVKKPQWLILIGVCTHLGCIPIGGQGDYNGWFCPCHGSHYDTSGRIRRGPAPLNLPIPPYKFIEDERILVGGD
eukprot:TRINITY_DN276_c0_g1_i1.p1 TRINITY_DN276_c0_g1~~TRINITY_DN276_c0_g1_i1.p1  ORF type:complete len:229 (-),score=60.97 TRINITY_DN276_c0_g1_i1:75-761(-)